MTNTPVKIRPEEKAELVALAKEAGVPLSEAMRQGARLYLLALTSSSEYKAGRPRKEAAQSAA